jgi:hypothetical protein
MREMETSYVLQLPLVSVVLPTFNRLKHPRLSVDSVFALRSRGRTRQPEAVTR